LKTYHNCIKCPDFAEYVGVLGKVKNDGDEMAPQDVFLVLFGEDIIEHITFHSNAKGETFKICY
jgi:hypothetical protein